MRTDQCYSTGAGFNSRNITITKSGDYPHHLPPPIWSTALSGAGVHSCIPA